MGFAAPLGLLALFSVAIPILVHLRRKPARPIRIGTLRYLEGSAPRPRAGARLSELVLLMVRMALLGLVAVALGEPFLAGDANSRPRSIAVKADSATDLWTMLRELEDTIPAGSSVALGVPGRVTVSGSRPSVAMAVTIQPVQTAAFATEPPRPARRRLVIVAPPARIEAVRYLRAAFGAVAALRGDSLEISQQATVVPDSLRGQWVVWLADSVPADSIAAAGASVLAEAREEAPAGLRIGRTDPGVFARRVGRGVLHEFAGRFDSDAAVSSAGLPELIAAIWPGADASARPARVTASQLQPARRSDARHDRRAPLAAPLLGVASLIFLAERVLAHRGLGRTRVGA